MIGVRRIGSDSNSHCPQNRVVVSVAAIGKRHTFRSHRPQVVNGASDCRRRRHDWWWRWGCHWLGRATRSWWRWHGRWLGCRGIPGYALAFSDFHLSFAIAKVARGGSPCILDTIQLRFFPSTRRRWRWRRAGRSTGRRCRFRKVLLPFIPVRRIGYETQQAPAWLDFDYGWSMCRSRCLILWCQDITVRDRRAVSAFILPRGEIFLPDLRHNADRHFALKRIVVARSLVGRDNLFGLVVHRARELSCCVNVSSFGRTPLADSARQFLTHIFPHTIRVLLLERAFIACPFGARLVRFFAFTKLYPVIEIGDAFDSHVDRLQRFNGHFFPLRGRAGLILRLEHSPVIYNFGRAGRLGNALLANSQTDVPGFDDDLHCHAAHQIGVVAGAGLGR